MGLLSFAAGGDGAGLLTAPADANAFISPELQALMAALRNGGGAAQAALPQGLLDAPQAQGSPDASMAASGDPGAMDAGKAYGGALPPLPPQQDQGPPQAPPQGQPVPGQGAPQGLPPQAMGPPQITGGPPAQFAPPFKPLGPVAGVIDHLLLGGVLGANKVAHYQAMVNQIALQNRMARVNDIAQTEGAAAAREYLNDPAYYAQTHQNLTLKPDETALLAGGPTLGGSTYQAGMHGFDEKSGREYAVGSSINGAPAPFTAAPTLGGDVSAKDGLIISGRTGAEGTYSQPNNVPITAQAGTFTPVVSGNGGSTGAPHPPAMGLGPAPQLGAPTLSGPSAPRGIRNNNYTNLTALPNGQQWPGQVGVDPGGYVKFATPQAGLAAAGQNLTAYATRHGINTVSGLVNRWAPAAAGNATAPYIKFVAGQMGVGPNDPINLTDPAVQQRAIAAIASFENGPKAFASAAAPPQLGAPGAAPGAAAGTAPAPAIPGVVLAPRAAMPGQIVPTPGRGTQRINAEGLPEPAPGTVGIADIQKRGESFMNEPAGPYNTAMMARSPLQSVGQLADPRGQNTGVVDMAAIDSIVKAMNQPTAQARQSMVQGLINHLGLPAEVGGKVLSMMGRGFLPQDILKSIYRTAWTFANEKDSVARQRMEQDAQFARSNNFDPAALGESIPPLGPVPAWAADPMPKMPQVGKIYWSQKGPLVWDGKGFKRQ